MIINHNIAALNTYNRLSANNAASSKSLEKLSSGLRINRAGDDAAGLAISEKMRGQIRGLDQATRNSQDGISMIQTAEGALTETHSILQRMRELAVQAGNDTNTANDRAEIQKEINQLTDEVDRIANTTEFNTKKLLDGSAVGLRDAIKGTVTTQLNTQAKVTVVLTAGQASGSAVDMTGTFLITRNKKTSNGTAADFVIANPNGLTTPTLSTGFAQADMGTFNINLTNLNNMAVGESITISFVDYDAAKTDASKSMSLQIGANSGQNILVGVNDMSATAIGIRNASSRAALDVSSYEKATAAVTAIDNATAIVSAERSKMGAVQNRLEHTINNLSAASENMTAAESRIRDVDMAKEMMSFQKNNILQQAATSMLAQANQQPQNVLQLLK